MGRVWSKINKIWSKISRIWTLRISHSSFFSSSFLFFSILHNISLTFPLFYTPLSYRLTYITLPSPLYPTLPLLLTILHYPSFLDPLLSFLLLSTLYYLPSLCPTLQTNPASTLPFLYPNPPFLLISMVHYFFFLDPLLPFLLLSILQSYTTLLSLYPTLQTTPSLYPSTIPNIPFLLISILLYPSFPLYYTTISSLNPKLPFFLSILHYPSFSLSYATLTSLYYSSFSLSYSTLQILLSILHYPGRQDSTVGWNFTFFRSNSTYTHQK